MARPKYLTKSRFQLALSCPTKLYYTANQEYADLKQEDTFLQALAEGGYQVGELAKYYHPGGYDITELDKEQSFKETNELLQKENVIIYEAAIKYKDFFIRVDVLEKTGNQVSLIEVKAKSFKSKDEFYSAKGYITKSWLPYLYDVAFQHHVMSRAFPDWEITPYLLLTDKNKESSVDGLNQLFRISKNEQGRKQVTTTKPITPEILGEEILVKVDVSNIVDMIMMGRDTDPLKKNKEDQKEFSARANEYSDIYESGAKYPVDIALKCKGCEFKNSKQPNLKSGYEECWKGKFGESFSTSEPHVYDIWNFRKSQKIIDQGVYYLSDIYEDSYHVNELNQRQLLQVEKTVTNDPSEWIDPKLYDEIESWTFPLHFIDFETSMVALPFNKGRRPYEQIAFQFSCHTLYKDGTVKHDEWINTTPGKFPNYEFVAALKNVLDKDDGTIFRYATHENTVLRQIQVQMEVDNPEEYGDLIAWIDTITEWKDKDTGERFISERNMVDLWKLVKQYYYHPAMKGSNSIKAVLPAIFKSSPYIKKRYSKTVGHGTHLKDQTLFQLDNITQEPCDPYKLLPSTFEGIDMTKDQLFIEDGEIQDGGAAMTAYAKMQFTEMSDSERMALTRALLQYCELDTLAMLMIYEHWSTLENKP